MRKADPSGGSQQGMCGSQFILTSRALRTRDIRTEQHELPEKTLSPRNSRHYKNHRELEGKVSTPLGAEGLEAVSLAVSGRPARSSNPELRRPRNAAITHSRVIVDGGYRVPRRANNTLNPRAHSCINRNTRNPDPLPPQKRLSCRQIVGDSSSDITLRSHPGQITRRKIGSWPFQYGPCARERAEREGK